MPHRNRKRLQQHQEFFIPIGRIPRKFQEVNYIFAIWKKKTFVFNAAFLTWGEIRLPPEGSNSKDNELG